MAVKRLRGPDAPLRAWFDAQGWTPAPFQREVWRRYLAGDSGLLQTPTGSGKTLAALGGPLLEALTLQAAAARMSTTRRGVRPAAPADAASASTPPGDDPTHHRLRSAVGPGVTGARASGARRASPPAGAVAGRTRNAPRDLSLLWITPLRALAADTLRAMRTPVAALGLDWQIGLRTGDASARDKRLAREGKLDALITTPESLSLLLSYPDTGPRLATLRCVIVDEWHELLGNKRGVLLQLALARLRALNPQLRIWGVSATLGNLDEARDALLPHLHDAPTVAGVAPKVLTIDTLLPDEDERFPWGGHLGLAQLPRVLERLMAERTSLLFCNTRSQAELWHRALSAVWPEAPETLALHHGSLDLKLRGAAEDGLRDGSVRCVVATSSLDLGVDFPAVDQVLQIGSPKGVARLLQRAGRAKHRPGEAGHVVCVPTHALELVEYAAAREAVAQGRIESRPAPRLSLDVLAQHCVTLALGGGFDGDALLAEVRGTQAFRSLDHTSWRAVLDFIVQGGQALSHYPDFRRVEHDGAGRFEVTDRRVALRHRLSIGTITSDGAVRVKLLRGGGLGSVEESFVGRMRAGDRFQFAGRTLELVRLEDMTAYVRVAKAGTGTVPKWNGGRMPLSSALAHEVERVFDGPRLAPEVRAIARLLDLQQHLSALPAPDRLLVEWVQARGGRHLFVFPFAGRHVHEGLAALLSLRWGRRAPNSFTFAVNDYGLVLSPAQAVEIDAGDVAALLTPERLLEDLRESLNLAELARRQFRDIARVAGLLPPSLPGRAPRSMRQLQASSGLLFDVLRQHDPDHMLLALAEREVFAAQLEVVRLRDTLEDCSRRTLDLHPMNTFTPMSFPLWAESLRGQLSTEDWRTRVQRAAAQLEKRNRG
ncbi:ligase-associated DNA damage response DEXH box helicase [Luteimonas deserti]|uniref:Ligase-associated DNA damage response DEXH box helicase n=1 Tax=Luteimonas deserti TaxID=2752306 RepID=A0A7Z0QRN8_9GAMM|nr:ligase-associated DNA damage response DEXH box helicase [Luteimonas deserti]NYZ62520.1 ligase-associated DNA damage response DEXH box helicase [Luteimonas deserti]